jgi:hypothetical protein
MSMPFASRLTMLVSAGVVGLTACAGESSAPTSALRAPDANFALGLTTDATPVAGQVKVCKSSASNVSGTFAVSRTVVGTSNGTVQAASTLTPGQCAVVAEDFSPANNGSNVTVNESNAGPGTTVVAVLTGPTAVPFTNGGTVFINTYHGYTITYTNIVETPPPATCDFITFGRLVTEVNGKKVVISGNAGGNAPGGGILGEFHIDANGVDNHVADIATYGPITSGPLSGSAYPNARMVTGTAKNGVKVELRLWDGGEPGKGTDVAYVTLDGVKLLGNSGQLIDQGNMQYHANCRGPKD